jgi:hypothetical protein
MSPSTGIEKCGRSGSFSCTYLMPAKAEKPDAEQAQGQPGGVLVGVEPDHQQAKHGGQQRTGAHAGGKAEPVVAGVHHGGEAGHGRAQHHALGAQVDDAGLLVDQQAQRRDGQHGAGVQRGGQQQGIGFHYAALPVNLSR